jgi:CubicO group peptidase (beta-lactamase class C family)
LRTSLLITILSILFVFSTTSSNAAFPAHEFHPLDDYIVAQMAKHGLKGISVAVIEGGETVYLNGYGSAGNGIPMTPHTPMYIGSTSKSFTGLAVAQLVESGLIDMKAPVINYLPWFKVDDQVATAKITVNHLLHHTSGMSEAGFTVILPEDASREEAVRALASASLTASPGAQMQYFNVGYDVLALIIETVSGQTYEAYIQEHIFQPLGMTRTYTDPELAQANGLSQGYSRFFGFPFPQRQPHRQYEVGAGYIISTAEDMARYAIAMNNDGVYQGNRVLSSEGMRRLFISNQGYGMGWFIEPGHIYHGGANETFKTFLDLYPNRKLGFILMINQGYMLDHYVSSAQVYEGVRAIVLGDTPPLVSQGPSVRTIGLGLLGFVLALVALHSYNFWKLRDWRWRASHKSPGRLAFDVAISFIIPIVIVIVVYTQLKGFFGYRFNLTSQVSLMFVTLTDIAILMLVGLVPDIIQGIIKLYWVLSGQIGQQPSPVRFPLQSHPHS